MIRLTKTQKEVMKSLPLRHHYYPSDKYYSKMILIYKSVNDRNIWFQERSVKSLIKKGLLTTARDEKGFRILVKK